MQIPQKIKVLLEGQLPFVAYRKPDASTITLLWQNSPELHLLKDSDHSGFLFAPFKKAAPYLLIPDGHIEEDFEDLRPISTGSAQTVAFTPMERENHLKLVERAVAHIKAGEFKKVVVSHAFDVPVDKEPHELFQILLQRYPKTFCYLWYHPNIGLWMGATPETLLHLEGDRLTTMSLAGTLPFEAGKGPEWGTKEVEEQALVTQYIQQNLTAHVAAVEVGAVASVRAGNLWHLRSILSGKNISDMATIAQALHPTPAVCGLPKEASKAFILDQEHYDREFYTGYLGEHNLKGKENGHLFVNLRCMQMFPNRAKIYVGGGITKDSVPEKEWNEILIKSNTMLQVINSTL